MPLRLSTDAVIAAVVVFPLVAEIMIVPRGRRLASSAIAPGSSAISTRPGRLVPPPRPARLAILPTARAAAIFAGSVLMFR